jgi:hypothetical protein
MTVVEAARRALGPVGVLLPFSRTSAPSAEVQRAAVRRQLEELAPTLAGLTS